MEQKNRRISTRQLVSMAMLGAISIVLVAVIHFPLIPAAAFLEYDPADIPILIGTFAYGPLAGVLLTVVVSVIQGMTVSSGSGLMGIAMHIFATSILVLVYVVLGGLGNIWGSIIAAALLTLLPELLRGLSNYRMLIYAILLIAMMLFNNSSLKKRMLEKRGMKQMEKLERAEKSGKEGA